MRHQQHRCFASRSADDGSIFCRLCRDRHKCDQQQRDPWRWSHCSCQPIISQSGWTTLISGCCQTAETALFYARLPGLALSPLLHLLARFVSHRAVPSGFFRRLLRCRTGRLAPRQLRDRSSSAVAAQTSRLFACSPPGRGRSPCFRDDYENRTDRHICHQPMIPNNRYRLTVRSRLAPMISHASGDPAIAAIGKQRHSPQSDARAVKGEAIESLHTVKDHCGETSWLSCNRHSLCNGFWRLVTEPESSTGRFGTAHRLVSGCLPIRAGLR